MNDTLDIDGLRVRGPKPIGPWTSDLLLRLLFGNAMAAGLIAAGCWQVSGAYDERTQVGWMVAVLAGLGAAGLTNGVWILRGLQSVSAARDQVVPTIRVVRAGVGASASRSETVAVQGGSRVHLATCALAVGKRTTPVDADDPRLERCGVCLPSVGAVR